MTRPFLILQLRPEDEAADEEFADILARGGLSADRVIRVRLDQDPVPEGLDLATLAGIITGGGPGCVSDPPEAKSHIEARVEAAALALMPQICKDDLPFMGCCYGLGVLTAHLGGRMGQGRYGEPVGGVDCALTEAGRADPLLAGQPETFRALVGHKEAVEELPPGAVSLVTSAPCPVQMIRYKSNVYATQFHPEATGESFVTRIRIYRDKGYFPPEQADALSEACRKERVSVPPEVLRRFVARYG
ncbi:MAG: glutamine amidotransferase [Rhodobacteraceae bacterium]|nr:glutamine amidotransferase [Paracoccaceae bacterium]